MLADYSESEKKDMSSLLRIIYTSFIYISILGPSVIFVNIAEKNINKDKKVGFVIALFIAIFLPCLLAGIRGEEVGNDVLNYAEPVYLLAKRTSSYLGLLNLHTRYEPGYLLLAYSSAHFFHSFNAMLFFTQLITIVPLVIVATKVRKTIPMWSTVLCYYCLFYIATFNIMRQGIGMAFILLSLIELVDHRPILSVLCAVIAIMFHNSAIIGYALILFVWQFRKIKSNQVRIALAFLLVIGIPLLISRWADILIFLSSHGIILKRYINYISYIQSGESYLTKLFLSNYLELIFRWLGLLIPFIFLKKDIRKNELCYLIFISTLLGVLIYTGCFVILHSSYGYRISFYLEIVFVLWISSLNIQNKNIHIHQFPVRILVMIMCLVSFFFIGYMWRGFHGTLPFYFQIYGF